jgi:uncharacterized protein YqgC (DUF456 family)
LELISKTGLVWGKIAARCRRPVRFGLRPPDFTANNVATIETDRTGLSVYHSPGKIAEQEDTAMELLSLEALILFITLFTMMIGLIFTVVPPLPGTLIIWGASIGYGLVLGWESLGWWIFGIMTVLMIVGVVADFLGGQFGAKLGGASCLAIIVGSLVGFVAGILGSVIGTPVFGCVAGLLGTLGGILLVERIRYQDWRSATSAVKGFAVGTSAGIAARLTAGLLMMGVFLLHVFLNR